MWLKDRPWLPLVAALSLPLIAGAAEYRPNIVLIEARDLGVEELRIYNAEASTQTPNIDSFAAQGIRLTEVHSAASIATPSQYAVLTGQYLWRSFWKRGNVYAQDGSALERGQ